MAKIIPLHNRIVYQIKISLLETDPLIWRRVLVPGEFSLAQLHEAAQVVMGWGNMHLYEFRIGEICFSEPDEEFPGRFQDSSKVTISKLIVRLPKQFFYTYDFGDSWDHEFKIEKELFWEKNVHYPHCTDGERACPPEDCGGIPGYEDILESLTKPRKKNNKDMIEWFGDFDPAHFSVEETNKKLKHVRS